MNPIIVKDFLNLGMKNPENPVILCVRILTKKVKDYCILIFNKLPLSYVPTAMLVIRSKTIEKQLKMTYSLSEFEKIVKQRKFGSNYRIKHIEVGNLPKYMRIELKKE
jgi:hypothetical protein